MEDKKIEKISADIQIEVFNAVKYVLENEYKELNSRVIIKSAALASCAAVEALKGKPTKK